MARQQDWQHEVQDALRREVWSLQGPTRPVKLVPIDRPIAAALKGFICLEKSLLGKTPSALESMLGLPPGSFANGCRVYRFKRLPAIAEVAYELTAQYPDGWAFNPALHDPDYALGSATVHQWRLLVDVPAQHLLDLKPGACYPYLHV